MFKAAGRVMCKIDDVMFAEPKFAQGENDFDICVHVASVDDPGQMDWWRGEVSQNYGKGNFANMTQAEITLQTLRNCGYEGDDLTTLKNQLVGKEIPVTVKDTQKDGKVYYNISYIGEGGGAPKEIDADTVKRRISALFGTGADKAAAAPSPASAAPATPKGSPFTPKQTGGTATPATGAGTAPKNPFTKK